MTDGILVEDLYQLGYREGYNKGISDGNINDGTFAQKVKEAYEMAGEVYR